MKKYCKDCDVLLELVLPGDDVWDTEHLICPKCDGTYNIEEKLYRIEKILEEDKKDKRTS